MSGKSTAAFFSNSAKSAFVYGVGCHTSLSFVFCTIVCDIDTSSPSLPLLYLKTTPSVAISFASLSLNNLGPRMYGTILPLGLRVVCIGRLSSALSSVSDTVRKLAGDGTYSTFFVVFKGNSGVPSVSDCAGNCVGPSLSVSTELGLSFACLGFLNGLETVLTVRAEYVLALDCHACLSIL
jgi:hypothetical protein